MDEKKFLPDLFDQQLFDVLHPTRFKQNFGALHSFKSYIMEYCKPDNRKYVKTTRLAQWRVLWLIEHSTLHQFLWCIDSFVLRTPPLRQAPKP